MTWDVGFGRLVGGVFRERLSRFHARVTYRGEDALAHVPNSGRLRELLVPGSRVGLRPAPPGRRTAFDLLVARIPEEERGPGWPGGWASLDARLPPRLVAAAAGRGVATPLRGQTLLRWEPPLAGGRADVLFGGPHGETVVEAKSITLVRAGAGLFPDSPTNRGTEHLRRLARERRRSVVAFVVQRSDARAVRVNEPADPAFARALRAARRAGVEVVCLTCEVASGGVRVLGEVPLEEFHPGARVETLPDHLAAGLRLVFCGLNPGRYAAWYGAYFARPGNRFWPLVRRAGIVPPTAGPGDEPWLRRRHGIGFTDVCKRPTDGIDEITRGEWEEGAHRLRGLVRRYRPGVVCFVGLRGARAVLGSTVAPGPQDGRLEGSWAFVVPSTSGRQAAYPEREIVGYLRQLASWVRG